MNDEIPFHYHGKDGARYTVDVVRDRRDPDDPHYDVDLVRSSVDQHGLTVEQRLTLEEYETRQEAETFRSEVEDTLTEEGLAGLGDAVQRIIEAPYLYDGQYIVAMFPPDAEPESRAAAHLLHLNTQGVASRPLVQGSAKTIEPVVAAADQGYADDGYQRLISLAVESAQENHLLTEAEKLFEPELDYRFDYHLFDVDAMSLEAHKTWRYSDGTRGHTSIILDLHDQDGNGEAVERFQAEADRLNMLRDTEGLESAMHEAEKMAVANDFLNPHRADGALFGEGPKDPFQTLRDHELAVDGQAVPNYLVNAISSNGESHLDVLKTWSEEGEERLVIPQPDWESAKTHAETAHYMLDHDDLQGAMNYVELVAVEQGVLDPNRDDPRLFIDGPLDPFTTVRELELMRINIQAASPPIFSELDSTTESHAVDRFQDAFSDSSFRLLEPLDPDVNYSFEVMAADPWTLELRADKWWLGDSGVVENQTTILNSYELERSEIEREITQEIAQMDREALVSTYRDQGLQAAMHRAEEIAIDNGHLEAQRDDPRLFTDGPPDRFQSLSELEPPSVAGTPSWRLETLPVNTPNGEPLGHALFCMRDLEVSSHNAEPRPEVGAGFEMLEMAHFKTETAADTFAREFRGYLVPDLLDGPELAHEVAQLEGLSGQWTALDARDMEAYQNAELTLTRDTASWHPHNPHAERDARLAAEGMYSDHIPPTEAPAQPISPDFDL